MIIIDTKAFILRIALDIIFFYIVFFLFNPSYFKSKKTPIVIIISFVGFLFQALTELGDIFIIIASYLLFKTKKKRDYLLLNKLLLANLIVYLIYAISSLIIITIYPYVNLESYSLIYLQELLKAILFLCVLALYKKLDLSNVSKLLNDKKISLFLLYIFFACLLFSYAAHYYKLFDQFIIGVILFLVVQTLVVFYFFYSILSNQKKQYEATLMEKELNHLKIYTEQLEKNQDQLAKFRHDYKNLLLSLKSISDVSGNKELLEQLKQLESYSENYMGNNDFSPKHMRHIKNSYLKSLLIAKFYDATQNGIQCHFECLEPIEEVPLPIFDCIRLLGIVLDNAIESAKECLQKTLSMMIYQDDNQVEFLIENSYIDKGLSVNELVEKGVTTKSGHQGLGLNTIKDINKANTNLFVQYSKYKDVFVTQLIVIKKK